MLFDNLPIHRSGGALSIASCDNGGPELLQSNALAAAAAHACIRSFMHAEGKTLGMQSVKHATLQHCLLMHLFVCTL